jgi:choline dehydrogenase
MQVKLRSNTPSNTGPTQQLNTLPKQLVQGIKYLLTRKGPIATAGYDVVSHFKSDPRRARPDVQGIWVPFALDISSPDTRLAKHSGITFLAYPIRPTTHSSIHITGSDPAAPPVIHSRFLENAEDEAAAGPILRHARHVLSQSPLAEHVLEEEFPGPAVSTDAEVVDYSRATGGGIFHAVGANAMGPDDSDVVDLDFRVRGVGGLRVADVSVFPLQPSGNTAAPTMALAWIAADRILASHRA